MPKQHSEYKYLSINCMLYYAFKCTYEVSPLFTVDGLIADCQFAWFILILFNIFGSDFVLFNSFF